MLHPPGLLQAPFSLLFLPQPCWHAVHNLILKLPAPCTHTATQQPLQFPASLSPLTPANHALQVDFVGVPFTTSAKDVEDCRALLARCNLSSTKVIAKIEDVDGLRAHQEIIEAADVIIFARGKLGTRLDPAKVREWAAVGGWGLACVRMRGGGGRWAKPGLWQSEGEAGCWSVEGKADRCKGRGIPLWGLGTHLDPVNLVGAAQHSSHSLPPPNLSCPFHNCRCSLPRSCC